MTGLLIVHVLGDEAAAHELSVKLATQHPICSVMGDGCERLRLGAHMSLIIVWSQTAAALEAGGALGEVCFHHDGPVLLCLTDDAPLPEELDDSGYRWIDLSIDDEELRHVQRMHELIASAARERRVANLAERARRRRLPVGRAFGGGALAGLATSVALLGAAGATAISAADQMTHEDAAERSNELARARADGPFMEGIPPAPRHEAWMELRPAAPPAHEREATERKLEAVGARVAAFYNATEGRRVRIEQIAGQTWSSPAPSPAAAPAPVRVAEQPRDAAREAVIARIRSHPLVAVRRPVDLADSRAPIEHAPSLTSELRQVQLAASESQELTPVALSVEPVSFSGDEMDMSVDLALELDDAWLPRTEVAERSSDTMTTFAVDETAIGQPRAEGDEPF